MNALAIVAWNIHRPNDEAVNFKIVHAAWIYSVMNASTINVFFSGQVSIQVRSEAS